MRVAAAAAAACALAVAGHWLPAAPVYDAWSWLVWGRELTDGALDTSAGPSWKPMTAFLAAPISLAGDTAPDLWLGLSRLAWLAAPLAAAALAIRIAAQLRLEGPERVGAALLAGAGVALLLDPETAWIRQGLGGLSEPFVAALLAGALERGLAARHGQALALGFGIALLRPEVWLLGIAYVAWLWRRDRRLALAGGALFALVALAWIVPDLIGAANPVEGPIRARSGSAPDPVTALRALGLALLLAPVALGAGAAIALVRAWRTGIDGPLIVGLVAIAWVAIVVVMAFAGFSGLARFSAPAATLLCALGGVGLALAIRALRQRRPAWPRLAVAGVGILLVADVGVRAGLAGDAVAEMTRFDRESTALERILGGVEAPACAPVTTNTLLFDPAVAWQLRRSLRDVGAFGAEGGGVVLLRRANEVPTGLAAALASESPVSRSDSWRAFELPCSSRPSRPQGRVRHT